MYKSQREVMTRKREMLFLPSPFKARLIPDDSTALLGKP